MGKRLPPRTPGNAYLDFERGDDIFLPDALLQDALLFYKLACDEDARSPTHPRHVERYVRAAVWAAFAALEAKLNQEAYAHAQAHKAELEPLVADVLLERETAVDEHGRIVERKRRMPFTARLSFLTSFLSGQEFPRDGELWRRLLASIALRDSFVHPKPPFPWTYEPEQAREVIDTVCDVLAEVQRLMGLEPMPWWRATSDEPHAPPDGPVRYVELQDEGGHA